MIRVAAGLLLAVLLGACSHLDTSSASRADGDTARQILITTAQGGSGAMALAGDPTTAYVRRRGYGPAPETERLLDGIASDYGLRRVEGWLISSLGIYCEVYELAPEQSFDELMSRVGADPRVESVQAMNVFETEGLLYNDPYASLQSALLDLSLGAAHERATGKGVTVAVIDSLVDDRHPDMRGRIAVRRDFAGNHRPTGRAEVHGTATAGIIASAANNAEGIVGVAPDAEIVALRACWTVDESTGRARCSSLSLAQALSLALELGVDVINLSLSGPYDPLLERLIDRALADGVIVVAAWDADAERNFPASHRGVIAARAASAASAATAASAGPAAALAPPEVLVAPGNEVLSTAPGSTYAFFSGNSMSAAYIAGVAALLVERSPGIDGGAVSLRLHETATASSINACRAVVGRLAADDCTTLSAAASPPTAAQAQASR